MRIRHVEEEIARRYPEGKMRCPTHLSVGQEAVAAGVGLCLNSDDLAVSGHRAHAHYLAKGGDLNAMIAEIYGKVTGCSRGKGGSMHLVDEAAGFMGSTAIVAGTIPVGVGLAYAMKVKGGSQVSCVFHGDGAAEAGAFFESVNFAALKKLPVLFICENNLYSVYSPLAVRQPEGRAITDMVSAIGIPSKRVDGNDAEVVMNAVASVLPSIRAGEGPYFLEFDTYRWREHCGPNYDNDIGYRSEDEYLEWKKRDPVEVLARRMVADGVITDAEIQDVQNLISKETDDAFDFAESSPFPQAQEAFTDLYAPVADGQL